MKPTAKDKDAQRGIVAEGELSVDSFLAAVGAYKKICGQCGVTATPGDGGWCYAMIDGAQAHLCPACARSGACLALDPPHPCLLEAGHEGDHMIDAYGVELSELPYAAPTQTPYLVDAPVTLTPELAELLSAPGLCTMMIGDDPRPCILGRFHDGPHVIE